MSKKVYIIGYALDAVLTAVEYSSNGSEVVFLPTAKVASPLDEYGDLVSYRFKQELDCLLPGLLNYTEYANPRFLYLPYDKVSITNRSNGVIQYPLSKKSFCDDAEWKACVDAFADTRIQSILNDKTNAPSKVVTAMKSVMPEAFAETFCKAMQTTRWRGTQLSHLTMYGFENEFSLSQLGNDSYNEYFYKPDRSYYEISAALMNIFNISVMPMIDGKTVKKYITSRDIDGDVVVMDNRIDQYLDYIAGRLDRTRMWCVEEKVPPEIRYSRDGFYYTPLNSCWGVSMFGDKCKRFMAEPVTTLYDNFISEIPSTTSNIKMLNQYASLISLYGDKTHSKSFDIMMHVDTLLRA